MNRLSLVAIILVVFGAGWFLGQRSAVTSAPAPTQPAPATPVPDTKSDEAQRLLEQSAKDIAAIEDETLRRAKADELLEKMLKLFMIDISLRLQKPAATAASTGAPTSPANNQPPPSRLTESQKMAAEKTENSAGLTPAQKRRFEIAVVTADDPRDLNKALEELAKQDFNSSYTGSKDLTPEQAEMLTGTLVGRGVFDDGRPEWRVRIQLKPSAKSTAANPSYDSLVQVTNSAGKNSRSRGTGNLKAFSVGSTDPLMFFIESGDDFFQIYKSKVSSGYNGLIFEAEGKRNMKATGRLFLDHRN